MCDPGTLALWDISPLLRPATNTVHVQCQEEGTEPALDHFPDAEAKDLWTAVEERMPCGQKAEEKKSETSGGRIR